jgi:hypothetical protein
MKRLAWVLLLISSVLVIASCKKNEVAPTVSETDQTTSRLAVASAANPNSLKITTIAGQPFHFGYAYGPGKQALFNQPFGIDLSEDGYLYVADGYNHKIRKILLSDNSVTTVNIPNAADGSALMNPYVLRVAKDGTLNIYADGFGMWIVKPDGTVLTPGHAANATLSPDIERDPSGNFFWMAQVDSKTVNGKLSFKAYLKKLYIDDATGLIGTSPLTLNVNAIEEPDRSNFDIFDFYPGYNGVKYVVINRTKLYKLSSSGVFSRIYKDIAFQEIYSMVSSRDSRTLYLAESGSIRCIANGVHKFLAGPNPTYHDGRDGTGSTADIFAHKLALSKDENTLYFNDLNTSTIRKMQLK